MASTIVLSHKQLTLADIQEHHSETEKALRLYFSASNPSSTILFAGLTQNELDILLQEKLIELDMASSFSILASIEASFQVDYHTRINNRLKDPVSRAFRQLDRKKAKARSKEQRRVSLEYDILQAWKDKHPEMKTTISGLIGALRFRHWLAHGRYWSAKLGRKYDYITLYMLSECIHNALPLH